MPTPLPKPWSETATDSTSAPPPPVRVAVAGLGRAGFVHAAVAAAIPNCAVAALVDARGVARRHARGVGFVVPVFDRVERLLARARPDVLVVCVPDAERARVARLALEAGVPVLVERPMTRTLAEAEELVLLARQRGLPLACAHALPFHPVFARAREMLASGALGGPRQVQCSVYVSRVFSPARQQAVAPADAAGGVLAHEGLDALFLLLELLGNPRGVRATASRLYGPHEDEVHARLLLPSGIEVGLDASWSVPGYSAAASVLEFEGENGKLLVSDDALELDLTDAQGGYRAGHTRLGLADLPQPARFDLDGEATYLSLAAFLDWVAGGEAPCHRGEQSLRALRVLDAIYRSAAAGGAEVPVAP